MTSWLKDFSFSAVTAGFVAVLIGFASSVAIIFQAAQAAGANSAQTESWIWALGIGMGVATFALSAYFKKPIIIVWSTPGAALLASTLQSEGIAQATGVFIAVGVLIVLVGLSGMFNRLTKLIPLPLASAMLAGILLQFGLGIFTALEQDALLVLLMVAAFVLAKKWVARYAVLVVLAVGAIYSLYFTNMTPLDLNWSFASPEWVSPVFSLSAIIGIGLPLFIVTMASQNMPGVAILKSSGYAQQSISPIISTTGFTTLALAPFGGFTFNLAAITAAICTGEEAHKDPDKRYIAGLSAGVFNVLAGIFATAVVALFTAFSQSMIAVLAGLALISTITASIQGALADNDSRDAAIMTFLLTASGVSIFGIASAFWGLLVGLIIYLMRARI